MAIRTYGDLKAAVLRMIERTGDPRAAAMVPDWISMAEQDMAARLRAPWLMQAATTTVDEEWEELPPDFLAIGNVLARYGGGWYPLLSASLGQISELLGYAGFPTHYCVEGFSLSLAPEQRPVDLRYTFWLKEQPLLTDDQTNPTLSRASAVYLYGACRHADVHYGDDAAAARHDAAFERALFQANDTAREWVAGDGITATMQPRKRRFCVGGSGISGNVSTGEGSGQMGPPGPQGLQGPPGPQGPPGDDGADGAGGEDSVTWSP